MMCLGMFMAILDIQIVATALPTIQSALGIAPDRMSWIQTAYLIAEIIAIPLTGFFTRLLGMRLLFMSATAVFTLASVGCAASGSFEVLIFWRVIQGFAGGALDSCCLFGRVPLLPCQPAGAGHQHCRRNRRSRADSGTKHRRLGDGGVVVALAVPDQPLARHRCRRLPSSSSCREGRWRGASCAGSTSSRSCFLPSRWLPLRSV